jgi:hypothetical protein
VSGADVDVSPIFDPEALTEAQCYGDACVGCHKRWPRPRTRVGRIPAGNPVLACEDCAPALVRPASGVVDGTPRDRPAALVAHN